MSEHAVQDRIDDVAARVERLEADVRQVIPAAQGILLAALDQSVHPLAVQSHEQLAARIHDYESAMREALMALSSSNERSSSNG